MSVAGDAWQRRFVARGYPGAEPLATGMEGAVYGLDDRHVAKVWERRSRAELKPIGAFYEQLSAADLEFATPRFLEVWEEDGVCVTLEPRLPGTPLDGVCPLDRPLRPEAVSCTLDVLAGLRRAGDLASARALPVLEEAGAMWDGAGSWSLALRRLLDRRLNLYGDQLRARLPGFDRAVDRLHDLLAGLPAEDLVPLHGDLIPANILVDADLRPLAVLDFGFFTTAGDPAFDLAMTASLYDMYGPRAAETEAAIERAAAVRWDLSGERMALYRAVYAVATANVYDPEGGDGHFRWCVQMLQRDDVGSLLGLDGWRRSGG